MIQLDNKFGIFCKVLFRSDKYVALDVGKGVTHTVYRYTNTQGLRQRGGSKGRLGRESVWHGLWWEQESRAARGLVGLLVLYWSGRWNGGIWGCWRNRNVQKWSKSCRKSYNMFHNLKHNEQMIQISAIYHYHYLKLNLNHFTDSFLFLPNVRCLVLKPRTLFRNRSIKGYVLPICFECAGPGMELMTMVCPIIGIWGWPLWCKWGCSVVRPAKIN